MTPSPQRLHVQRLSRDRVRRLVVLVTCAVLAAPAWLQAASPPPATAAPTVVAAADKDAEANYQAARAACLSGNSHQDRATCLKEAGAVRDERRSGRSDKAVSATSLQANALKRCEVQPPKQRDECERLARGEGSQAGSVSGGGVIKEIVTRVPAPDAPADAKR